MTPPRPPSSEDSTPFARATVGPIRQRHITAAAALLADPNPIHLDPGAVGALGLRSRTVNQGVLNLSYLLHAVTAATHPRYRVRRFAARLHDSVFEGDLVDCVATVDAAAPTGDPTRVTVVATVAGRTVVTGSVEIEPAIAAPGERR